MKKSLHLSLYFLFALCCERKTHGKKKTILFKNAKINQQTHNNSLHEQFQLLYLEDKTCNTSNIKEKSGVNVNSKIERNLKQQKNDPLEDMRSNIKNILNYDSLLSQSKNKDTFLEKIATESNYEFLNLLYVYFLKNKNSEDKVINRYNAFINSKEFFTCFNYKITYYFNLNLYLLDETSDFERFYSLNDNYLSADSYISIIKSEKFINMFCQLQPGFKSDIKLYKCIEFICKMDFKSVKDFVRFFTAIYVFTKNFEFFEEYIDNSTIFLFYYNYNSGFHLFNYKSIEYTKQFYDIISVLYLKETYENFVRFLIYGIRCDKRVRSKIGRDLYFKYRIVYLQVYNVIMNLISNYPFIPENKGET